MTSELERVSQVLAHDVDAEVIEEIAIEAGWAYSRLFDEVNAMPLPVELKIELFAVRRSYAIVSALVGVANRRGIPFNWASYLDPGANSYIVRRPEGLRL
jgi:hypothetical protein